MSAQSISPDRCAEGIQRHAVSEHAHKMVQGWFLLHASTHYALPPADRGQGKKSSPTVGLDLISPDKNPGFDAWIQESLTGFISRSTAFNYMAAARRAGLTLDMTEDAALSAAQAALSGVARLSDLYKPETDETKKPGLPPPPPKAPMVQAWLDFGSHADQLSAEESRKQKALFKLSLPELSRLQDQTRRALDVIKAAVDAAKKGAR